MVLGFVHQSGGVITIDSKPGKGTTIELLFPCTDEAARTEIPRPADATRSVEHAKSVLLVDDDEIVRTVLGEQLRDLGFKVDEVADGKTAIERIQGNGSYDVLLSDLAMPGMNGIETIKEALRTRPAMRALLMTGYPDEQAVGGLRDGVSIIRKPVNINDLVLRLISAD